MKLCGNCYYFGFFGLEPWCKNAKGPHPARTEREGCKEKVDIDAKVTQGSAPRTDRITEKP
jgi:hypothetical protein